MTSTDTGRGGRASPRRRAHGADTALLRRDRLLSPSARTASAPPVRGGRRRIASTASACSAASAFPFADRPRPRRPGLEPPRRSPRTWLPPTAGSTPPTVARHLVHLLAQSPDAAPTDELLGVLAEMTSSGSVVQRRISILVYADLEAAFNFLVRVFALGPVSSCRRERQRRPRRAPDRDACCGCNRGERAVRHCRRRARRRGDGDDGGHRRGRRRAPRHASELGAHIEYQRSTSPTLPRVLLRPRLRGRPVVVHETLD